MSKFKTISVYLRGQGKDEEIEKLLEREAKQGFSLVAFGVEHNPFEYRFVFSKAEPEKSSKS
jgi:hypothetical protein